MARCVLILRSAQLGLMECWQLRDHSIVCLNTIIARTWRAVDSRPLRRTRRSWRANGQWRPRWQWHDLLSTTVPYLYSFSFPFRPGILHSSTHDNPFLGTTRSLPLPSRSSPFTSALHLRLHGRIRICYTTPTSIIDPFRWHPHPPLHDPSTSCHRI